MGILKAETIGLPDVTMENFSLLFLISVVSGSNFCPFIGYLNMYSAVVFSLPG
jgi:hypothetical protein